MSTGDGGPDINKVLYEILSDINQILRRITNKIHEKINYLGFIKLSFISKHVIKSSRLAQMVGAFSQPGP